MENKKAAIYIRVSTDAQREEGYSIDAQKEMLAAYCVSKAIKDYEFYIDGGFTGSNIDRPELQRLIAEVKEKRISYVIVYKIDRLSRSQKDTLYLIEDVFNPYGVDFVSINESMDTSTPLGRLMLGILSAFAQLERENIRERTRMGMKERVKSGLWMGGGRIPFGYDYDKASGVLVPNSDADTVRKIYELYLDGYSVSKIAEKVGLKYEKLAYQILIRKSNAGYICYNDQEYIGRHEPIISLETYERAMLLMADRSINKITEPHYLLTGLITCGKCGAKMRYQKWGKVDCKIVCYSNDKYKTHLIKDPNCKNKKMWATDIEKIVLEDLFSFSLKKNEYDEKKITNQNLSEFLNDKYDACAKKIKKLYNLYADNGNEILLETIEELQKELEKITTQMKNENSRFSAQKNITAIKTKLLNLSESWEYMSKQEQKMIIRSCIDRIILTDDNMQIYYKFD